MQASTLIIGAGGLGSPSAIYLSLAGGGSDRSPNRVSENPKLGCPGSTDIIRCRLISVKLRHSWLVMPG